MTCQHCQTEIFDDDYRCRRCGRRMRSFPSRPATASFPVSHSATARAYDFAPASTAEAAVSQQVSEPQVPGQQPLFDGSQPSSRVIAFESITTRVERQAIQARAATISRPAPLKTERVQIKHARAARARAAAQRRLEFEGQDDSLPLPQTDIICDAPVAPARLRLLATAIDAALIAIPCAVSIALYLYVGGQITTDKHTLPFILAAWATIPLFYKLLFTFAGCDSVGMRQAGLQLVDFDGNPPSSTRRYQRCLGSLLSLSAAGIGLIWSLVDEDHLTWHDHISGTFPTFLSEE